jgi:superfamily II DNA helicase RecQ
MAEASIPKKLLAYDANQLSNHIENDSFDKYQQKCKPLQVKNSVNLIRGHNTFLLAATGFGKSRIPEIYLNMTTKDCNSRHIGVVIVLNPLDALGDNQVTERIAVNYTAINLTAANFNTKAEIDLRNGVFNFIYLSPKIFLNNKTFEEIYISPNFQKKLVLVVVDKAHDLYLGIG